MSHPRDQIVSLALEYHKSQEGEYGCPGVSCPGVQRLVIFGNACADIARADQEAEIAQLKHAAEDAYERGAIVGQEIKHGVLRPTPRRRPMAKKRLCVNVTLEDIMAGHRRDPEDCPLALALVRLAGLAAPYVGNICVEVTLDGTRYGGRFSPSVRAFVRDYDAGRAVVPQRLTLEVTT